MIRESDVSECSHCTTHFALQMFTILTRLKDPKRPDIDLIKKMRLYDGETVEGYNAIDVEELQREYQDEGMKGIDPRYVINRISSTIIRKEVPSINALDVLRSLKDGLDQHPSISNEDRERYMNFISWRKNTMKSRRKSTKAFVYSYEESAKTHIILLR